MIFLLFMLLCTAKKAKKRGQPTKRAVNSPWFVFKTRTPRLSARNPPSPRRNFGFARNVGADPELPGAAPSPRRQHAAEAPDPNVEEGILPHPPTTTLTPINKLLEVEPMIIYHMKINQYEKFHHHAPLCRNLSPQSTMSTI